MMTTRMVMCPLVNRMRLVIGPLLLFSIIALTACGSESKTLTVEEYAAATCDLQVDVEDLTWGEAQTLLTVATERLREINPPAVLEDYHQYSLASVKWLSQIANEQDKDDPMNTHVFLEARLLGLGMSAPSEDDLLDYGYIADTSDVRLLLTEHWRHGCIDDDGEESGG